jgi:DDE superfamily endonuclease
MFWDGAGYACRIDEKMDGDLYVKILEEDLQESVNYYDKSPGDVIFHQSNDFYIDKSSDDIIFQQDNDSKHTCKKAQAWFQDHDFKVLLWPAQSADLNPIEHLWDHLKRKLAEYEVAPKGILELWERVEKEWNKIDVEVCQNLIESMPRRIAAVLKAKGGYTKY